MGKIPLMNDREFTEYCIQRDDEYADKLQEEANSERNLLNGKLELIRKLRANVRKWKRELKSNEFHSCKTCKHHIGQACYEDLDLACEQSDYKGELKWTSIFFEKK